MRKTVKQLEAELAAAKAEAAQWKEAHRQLAEAMAKQPAPLANTVFTTLTVDGVRQ